VTARILVADDEFDIVEPVTYALRREGFEAETVGDGEAALEAARSGSYDLLILDVMMPKLSGFDVCRTLRAESDLPIIMLTARDAEVDHVLGLDSRALHCAPSAVSASTSHATAWLLMAARST
jgi:DNA-binding response OmpR family regulator